MNRLTTIILLFVLTIVISIADANEAVKVYILAGQSNMDGRAPNGEFPAELQETRPDIPIYFIDEWLDLQLGLNTRNPGERSGPEITFGRSILEKNNGKKIALIKSTLGGSSLYYNWKPYTGPQWIGMVADVTDAMAQLSENYNPIIVGFTWMQGENDTLSQSTAEAYEQNLTDFIAAVRSEFNTPDLPFIIAQISEGPTLTYGEIVRQAQFNVSQNVPNTAMFITSDLGLQSDNVHYDTNGVIELGYRFANAMDELDKDIYLEDLKPISKDWTSKLYTDIYFADTFDAVNDANTSSPSYVGNFSCNTYCPAVLEPNTTYYWRSDEIDVNGLNIGQTCQFTTGTNNTNIGWWKLYDSLADISGYNNDGTMSGLLKTSNDPNWVKGIKFDGSNNYIDIPNEPAFDLTDAITIAAWVKVDAQQQREYTIASKGNSFWFYIDGYAGSAVFSCEGLGRPIQATIADFNNQWHHLVAVYDGSQRAIYVDGVLAVSSSSSAAFTLNDYNFIIGSNPLSQDNSKFQGLLREVRIYSSRLADEEILALSNTHNYSPDPFDGQRNIPCDVVLKFFPQQWITNITGDINGDFVVDMKDFAVFANNWLGNYVN